MNYATHVSRRANPQTEPASPLQQQNSAGGYSFVLDDWGRLDRFLVLGADGGTYYAAERKLTKENAACVERCFAADPIRAADRIADMSESGRCPKNDPAIFALALGASHPSERARKAALSQLQRVCRTGTHILQFAAMCKELRGFGRGLRSALSHWYRDKSTDDLAYQAVKYQSRGGWSHRDVLRLSHAEPRDPGGPGEKHAALFRWISCGDSTATRAVTRKRSGRTVEYGPVPSLPALVQAYERMKRADSVGDVVKLIGEHRLTHEMVPTKWQADADVWRALLPHMPLMAMTRSLGRLTANGVLAMLSDPVRLIVDKLKDRDAIRRARLHPLSLLVALKTYQQGHGDKGKLSWEPLPQIVDALDAAFYLAFENVVPTGKNILLAVDVSGSMDGGSICGAQSITPRIGAAAMAMAITKTEHNWGAVAFSSGLPGEYMFRDGSSLHSVYHRLSAGISPLPISPSMRLDTVVEAMKRIPMGGTDCSLPMLYAKDKGLQVDAFVLLTDSETWANPHCHPHQALRDYRNASGRDAKLVVVGMTASDVTVCDPNDPGQLNVAGFDTAAPQLISDFIKEGSAIRNAA